MKPFLLITSRSDTKLAAAEYTSYQKLTGLKTGQLEWYKSWQKELAEKQLSDYSGIILAGSPYTVSDPIIKKSVAEIEFEQELAELLDRVVALDFPMLGICYGIGTIGSHQGAIIGKLYGETTSATTIALTAAGESDPLFQILPQQFSGYVGHKEAVSSAPSNFTILASSEQCPVQAFRVKNNIYATQFHPELEAETMVARIIAYADHGYFEPTQLESLIAEIRAADVKHSHAVLRRFIELYATE